MIVVLTAMAPISELRGAIPIGLALGLPSEIVILTSVVANCLVFFPIYFGLKYFYSSFLSKYKIVQNRIDKIRKKGKPYVDKYGILGILLFIAVPLPFTGAWTGTVLAWLMGLGWKRSFITIFCGVLIAGVIVTVLALGILNGFIL